MVVRMSRREPQGESLIGRNFSSFRAGPALECFNRGTRNPGTNGSKRHGADLLPSLCLSAEVLTKAEATTNKMADRHLKSQISKTMSGLMPFDKLRAVS